MSTIPATGHISNAARTEGEVKQDLEDIVSGLRQVPGAAQIELTKTIAGDSITPDGGGGVIVIDTEAAATTDNLANIVTTNQPDGSMLLLRNSNSARTVVLKSLAGGAGQMNLDRTADYALDDTKKWLLLQRRGSDWYEVLRGPARLATPVLAKTGTYTVLKEDIGKLLTGSGTFTFNLLAGASAGNGFAVRIRNIGTGLITLDPNSAELIDGVATLMLLPGQDALLTCDGTDWHALCTTPLSGQYPQIIENLRFSATVASNALTIAVKTNAGNDPSPLDPIYFTFRSATGGNGDFVTIALTAALSLVVSSGSTLGTVNAVGHRLYVGICNDAGTLRLFVYNPLVAATSDLLALTDDILYTSVSEGGAGAADSAQVLYSGTAFTTKAVRLLGYIESTQATAGTWATTPSKIHALKPWDKRTGEVVQLVMTRTGEVATGATSIPLDDTIPQNTEGNEFMTKAITPRSAINLLFVEHWGHYACAVVSRQITAALFQDSNANALALGSMYQGQSGAMAPINVSHQMRAATTSATMFKIRTGSSGADTITFNGVNGARQFGGVIPSTLQITEIMV